ncbi:hypothetical protein [Paractinoplanes durhamensis]|uniref:hypothetical protein n=1 Tax=Paractinoplanes durhamensis TaxID=113563 RepID=UPI0036258E6B
MTDIAPADAELLRLETALTTIAANLVDLDDNPARKDLDKTKLSGQTAAKWADATDALTQLWDGYRMLTELTTSARQKRDQRRLSDTDRAAFAHQVLGRSITLSTTIVPLAQRGLLGTSQVHSTCSPPSCCRRWRPHSRSRSPSPPRPATPGRSCCRPPPTRPRASTPCAR